MLRALDAGVPDDDQQALDFFMNLDDAKYGDCKHDYQNRANKAETQLQNIEEAYQLATEYTFTLQWWTMEAVGEADKLTMEVVAAAVVAEAVEMAAEVAAPESGALAMDAGKKAISNETVLMSRKPSRKK